MSFAESPDRRTKRKGVLPMKKMFMVIVSVLSIVGITVTAVCMPYDRFD